MAKNITLNSTNVIGQKNNLYQKEFINGGLEIGEGEGIFVDKLILPNSVCNISPALKNNYYAYGFPSLTTALTTNILYGTLDFTSPISNTNTIIVDCFGYLPLFYEGYRIILDGLTTATPIIITAISGGYGGATQTLTLNQRITTTSINNVYGFIYGNKILARVSSGVLPAQGLVFNPSLFFTTSGTNDAIPVITNTFIFSTSIVEAVNTGSNSDNLFVFTLNFTFTEDFFCNSYTGNCISVGYEVEIPTGNYSITGLYNYLESILIQRGHYWWDKVAKKNYFPFSYENYLTTYKSKRNIRAFLSIALISAVFGSNTYYNNPYLMNGNFTLYGGIPSTTSFVRNTFPYWGTSVLTNSMVSHLGNGAITFNGTIFNYFIPSTSNYIAFVAPAQNPQIATGSLSQSVYLPSGNYKFSLQAIKARSGAASICRLIIDGTTYDFIPTANVLNNFSQTFTQATSATIIISIGYNPLSTEITGNTLAITNCFLERTDPNFSTNEGGFWINYQNGNMFLFENYSYQKYGLQTGYIRNTYSLLQSDKGAYPIFPISPRYPNSVINNPSIYQIGYYLEGENSQNLGYKTASSTTSELANDAFVLYYGFGLNPIQGVIIKCNFVRNIGSSQSTQLISFPLTYPFGSNNYYQGDKRDVMPLEKGRYNSITFELCDQYGNPLTLLDNNVLMNFVIGKINLLGI